MVGTQRGSVTPTGGRSPLMTEIQLFKGAFLTRTLVDGLSLLLPLLLEPPHDTNTDRRTVIAAADPIDSGFLKGVILMILSTVCSTSTYQDSVVGK